MYPQLRIDIAKLAKNLKILEELAKKGACSLMIVTKSFCADSGIIDMLLGSEYLDYLADSRIENLESYADKARMAGKETVLLRLPQHCEIEQTVRWADISLNSDIDTLRLLDEEAERQNRIHKVILMIDMGDLREGVFYRNEEEIFELCGEVLKMQNVKLEGLGVNLSCYGAIMPKADNLGLFCEIAEKIEKRFSIKLPIISGGNSSSLYLIPRGELPAKINNLRLGESFILGRETAYGEPIPGAFGDAIQLRAQIIELKDKPSVPIGEVGMDAFGNVPEYEDRGIISRAILAVGKQDTDPDGLTPLNTEAEILGASSDHLLMDASGCGYKPGDTVDLSLDYSALLKLFTSKYVKRVYLNEE